MSEAPASFARGSSLESGPGRASFSDAQKESFAALSASMSFVGVCLMLLNVLLVVFALGAAASGFPTSAGVCALLACAHAPPAWWTMSAGRSLAALVRTRGGDGDHLMVAVQQMQRLFAYLRAAIIVAAVAISVAAALYMACSLKVGSRCSAPWM